MVYYWTTMQDSGDVINITEGGHYEALDRDSGRLKSGLNNTVPSSDIPEVCVSGSPQASLFAKIQSARKTGLYYIYQTDETPDIEPSKASLDFKILDEYRYNMKSRDSISFEKYTVIQISSTVIKDIEYVYEYSDTNSVNEIFAENIKSHLKNLINNSASYPSDLREQEKERRFNELSDAYGEDYAKDVLDYK